MYATLQRLGSIAGRMQGTRKHGISLRAPATSCMYVERQAVYFIVGLAICLGHTHAECFYGTTPGYWQTVAKRLVWKTVDPACQLLQFVHDEHKFCQLKNAKNLTLLFFGDSVARTVMEDFCEHIHGAAQPIHSPLELAHCRQGSFTLARQSFIGVHPAGLNAVASPHRHFAEDQDVYDSPTWRIEHVSHIKTSLTWAYVLKRPLL